MGKKKKSHVVQEEKRKKQGAKAAKKKLKQAGVTDVATVEEILATLEETDAKLAQGATKAGVSQPTLVSCSKPCPRAACTLTVLPSSGEVLLFGGEYFDGAKATVFNDTFKWNVEKGEWRVVEGSGKVPQRRCAHQAAVYKDSALVFGGEFSTIDQFYHFKDLWSFDMKSNVWSEVATSGAGPSPRSGHRMVVWRSFLVVFGGFHDTLRETRYFNDLYLLCLRSMRWRKVQFPPHANIPPARSGCQFMLHQPTDCVLMYGGYAKVKDSASGAQGKQFDDCWFLNLKPLAAGQGDNITSATVVPEWQKISRKSGQCPSVRSGASMALYKNMAIMFGGVYDEDDGTTSLRSLFYNDLYGFDVEQKRWYLLGLRVRKGDKRGQRSGTTKKQAPLPVQERKSTDAGCDVSEEGSADGDEYESDIDERTFGYIDQDGKLVRIPLEDFNTSKKDDELEEQSLGAADPSAQSGSCQKAEDESISTPSAAVSVGPYSATGEVSAEPSGHVADNKKAAPSASASTAVEAHQSVLCPTLDKPLPRINANLFIKGPNLYVYGGLVEIGKKTLTLDDCWKMNLNVREAWECVERGTIDDHAWHEEESSDGSIPDDDDFSDDEFGYHSASDMSSDSHTSSSDSSGEEEPPQHDKRAANKVVKRAKAKSGKAAKASHSAGIKEKMAAVRATLEGTDPLMTPRFEESLREFYERTQLTWVTQYSQGLESVGAQEGDAGDDHPTGVARQMQAPKEVLRTKEIKRGAFDLAAKRYAKIEPLLEEFKELEREQREIELSGETKKTKIGKR